MKVQCTVVTTPTSDTPGTCILLHFDSKRYLFGYIGEGAQQAFVERTIRLTKISDIFLSGRTEWQNTGGLVGLILTMGDQDVAKISDTLGNPQGVTKKRNLWSEKELRFMVGRIYCIHLLPHGRLFLGER